jgi:hypothetical protein
MLRTLTNIAGRVGEPFGVYSSEKAALDHTEYMLLKSYYDNGRKAVETALSPGPLYGNWPDEPVSWGIRADGTMYRYPPMSTKTLASNALSKYLKGKIDNWNTAPEDSETLDHKRAGIYRALQRQFAATLEYNKRAGEDYKKKMERLASRSTTGTSSSGLAPGSALTSTQAMASKHGDERVPLGGVTSGGRRTRRRRRRTKKHHKKKGRKTKSRRR